MIVVGQGHAILLGFATQQTIQDFPDHGLVPWLMRISSSSVYGHMRLSSLSKSALVVGKSLVLAAIVFDVAYALWVMTHDIAFFWC